VVLVVSIAATLQNYPGGSRQVPRWLSAALSFVEGMAIGALLIAAIS
jgi:hypothetical protein